MTEKKDYSVMVSIRCATYNQVNYIRRCLDGFVMQKTTFPFEAVVHDDASTDGTTEIVREYAEKYPDIIKPLYEDENVWSKHDGTLGKRFRENMKGKYIAPCDGDDYWKDPLKLQKQVDFLESHPDYTMIHTGFDYIDMEGKSIPIPDDDLYKRLTERIRNGYIWDYLLNHSSFIIYSTILFREQVLEKEIMGIDHGVFMACSRQGKVQYLPDVTASYRIVHNSYMRTRQEKIVKSIQNAIFCQLYYYCTSKYNTLPFYRYNIQSRIAVGEGIISSLGHFSELKMPRKAEKMLLIVFARPLNLIMLPVAFCKKVIRKLSK